MEDVVMKMYQHVFCGGTFEQVEKENIIILIMHYKKGLGGVFKRMGGDPLYFKKIVFMNTVTGESFIRTPADWGNLDPIELQGKLDKMGL